MRFHFKPVLTMVTALCLGILLWLGTWQMNKVGPKTALIESVERGLSATPVPLGTLWSASEIPDRYRRVTVTGQFQDLAPLKRFGGNREGEAGYHLYGLLETAKGPILATYGWTPFAVANVPAPPTQEQVFSAVVMYAGNKGPFTPDNNKADNDWYWTDIASMAAALGAPEAPNFLLALEGEATENLMPGQYRIAIPNDHFNYALTWYGLALSLIGVYAAFSLNRQEQTHG